MVNSKIKCLNQFMSDHDIKMHGISIKANASSGLHIIANKDLTQDEIVALIPKNSVLSTKTTAIADVLESAGIKGLLGLAISLMFEKARGSDSPWYDYINSLPEMVEIPLLWSHKELEWLDGTDLGNSVLGDKEALRDDYDYVFSILKDNQLFHPLDDYSFQKFQYASSIVSSRAFNVDDYHEQSMVPLADVFNHSSIENVHFQCNPNVCGFCGESGICDCEILDQILDQVDEIEKDKDFLESEQEPPLLYNGRDDDQDSLNSNESQETEDQGMMEMVIVHPCAAKKEVFNTYGYHPNSYLLNRYGFCEEDNPHDVLNIHKQDIISIFQQLPVQQLSKRLLLWEKNGRVYCQNIQKKMDILKDIDVSQEEAENYIEGEDEDDDLEDFFHLDYNSDPSFDLYCFLQLMLMKISVLKIFMANVSKLEAFIGKLADIKWNNDKSLPLSLPMRQIIYQICEARKSKYSTTLLEDLSLYDSIKDTDQQKLKSALILRISDKKIIKRFFDKSGV